MPAVNRRQAALAAAIGRLTLIGVDTPRPQLAFGTEASDALLFTSQVALSLATFLESGDRRGLKLSGYAGFTAEVASVAT